MNMHEYQAKELLRQCGVPVPMGFPAFSATAAEFAMLRLPTATAVVKAQIHAGGRGKAGGVKVVKSLSECRAVAESLLGKPLITPQTDSKGKVVNRLYIEETANIAKEFYLALLLDRSLPAITVVASTQGGMDIEEVAAKTPDQIIKVAIDPSIGLQDFYLHRLSIALGLQGTVHAPQFHALLRQLYALFLQYDLSLLEINPLALVGENGDKLLVLDSKITSDDNATYRQQELQSLRDFAEEDARELEAAKFGLSYICLAGNIGCLVNGAGLAMATMDIVKHYGGQPSNFLDMGGGASAEQIKQAVRIVLQDQSVQAILINIFGGIVRCDIVADGLITTVKELGCQVPIVVRLEGTNVDAARDMLQQSGLRFTLAENMADGAQKVVAAANKAS
ncbi:MAG: ADP-forming succinate--CoA ligase subunit beta [Pseudomonadota bacterium]|nr:ADP-forming succinate--CoA ligase subunit beta [Pseudomonadota bacterium]